VGLDGRWLKVPPSLCALLGVTEERLLGTPVEAVLHPDDVPLELAERERLVRGDTRTLDLETRCLRPGGRPLWMYVNASVVEDGGGRPQYLLMYLRDITERKSLEDQLRLAQKMEAVGQLAGGIAHDFNNLLTAILGSTELLLADTDADDPRRDDVQEIGRAAHRASALVRQLLAFSRKQVMQPRLVNLNAIVREMGGMLRRLVGERITLRLDLDPALGDVTADPGQLEQVIANLGVNARDAMPHGGTLTIATHHTAGRDVRVTVADTGIGMSESVRQRIFEPFFSTKGEAGSGLGLSMAYSIVRRHAGEILVDTAPSAGTTFTLIFPVGPESLAPASPAQPTGTRRHARILVVDDDSQVLSSITEMLRSVGHTVSPSSTGRAAIAEYQPGRFDIVITNIGMAGMNGWEVAERLRAIDTGVPLLFITGWGLREEDHARLGALGVNRCLFKPLGPTDLDAAVQEALGT
jgi:PAS domain S-box-containing protein